MKTLITCLTDLHSRVPWTICWFNVMKDGDVCFQLFLPLFLDSYSKGLKTSRRQHITEPCPTCTWDCYTYSPRFSGSCLTGNMLIKSSTPSSDFLLRGHAAWQSIRALRLNIKVNEQTTVQHFTALYCFAFSYCSGLTADQASWEKVIRARHPTHLSWATPPIFLERRCQRQSQLEKQKPAQANRDF